MFAQFSRVNGIYQASECNIQYRNIIKILLFQSASNEIVFAIRSEKDLITICRIMTASNVHKAEIREFFFPLRIITYNFLNNLIRFYGFNEKVTAK